MTPGPSTVPGADAPTLYVNRELSWLGFARRVLSLADSPDVPLLERVRFAGIMGILHDEFFMKRVSGLKRQIRSGAATPSIDGLAPDAVLAACRHELLDQMKRLARIVRELRAQLVESGIPILDYKSLAKRECNFLRDYFKRSVEPILTPLAVDKEHPFPFISNLGLNLAVILPDGVKGERFVRIKLPGNRPRFVPLPQGKGFVLLEHVIAHNLDLMLPGGAKARAYMFRVTRGAEGESTGDPGDETSLEGPGSIVQQVTNELKSRRFAGVVRLQVQTDAPKKLVRWLSTQLEIGKSDVYTTETILGIRDLAALDVGNGGALRYPPHTPAPHPRLAALEPGEPAAIFDEIHKGDILLHHPYQSFDSSVLRFLESAAVDPAVLAIKLTIYRTSADSPIARALAEAARRGKQVAVLVEITARFDEAPNIAWGKYLENEGVHVSYGVRSLKTHVKLALVVRDEQDGLRRYLHAGTGNYHTGTARIYEDVGLLTCDPRLCEDAAAVFNALTGATSHARYAKMLVAPANMRDRFVKLIRREAAHAKAGRPAGIRAKMNQLQDTPIIEELYAASRAGVPIRLYVRGLCCLRPGVPGVSETIRVGSVIGRFLEHSRIYEFTNGGETEYFIGSADWMRRNLSNRVETVFPVADAAARAELLHILDAHDADNCSAWDCGPDGVYTRRQPAEGQPRRALQEMLIASAQRLAAEAREPEDGAKAPPSLRSAG